MYHEYENILRVLSNEEFFMGKDNAKDKATIVHDVADQGHFGISSCSSCGTTLHSGSSPQSLPSHCPQCKREFEVEAKIAPGYGGSDFP
jgi:predicted Zn-ribbon and HTH transcriptional regulator